MLGDFLPALNLMPPSTGMAESVHGLVSLAGRSSLRPDLVRVTHDNYGRTPRQGQVE